MKTQKPYDVVVLSSSTDGKGGGATGGGRVGVTLRRIDIVPEKGSAEHEAFLSFKIELSPDEARDFGERLQDAASVAGDPS